MGALSPPPVNDLSSVSLNHPLSGNMGRVLSDKIDNIPPGHNFIEILSNPTSNSAVTTLVGRTMQNHGVDTTLPIVIVDGITLDNTQLVRSMTHPMYYDFSVPVTLTEGGNSIRIESDNSYPLTKIVSITLNTPPIISNITIHTPGTQTTVKNGDVFTVDIPISGVYDSVVYSSTYFSITNPTLYELTKTLTFDLQAGIFVDSGTTLSVTVSNSLNGTSAQRDFTILIEDRVPTGTIKIQRNQAGTYLTAPWLPVGTHFLRFTPAIPLAEAPTILSDEGVLGTWTFDGTQWRTTLTISVGGNQGIGTLTGTITGTSGLTNSTFTNPTFHWDKVDPVVISATVNVSQWYSPQGAITVTVDCGENTTGFTGTVDLSAFGGSATATLSSSGNTMIRTFTPTKQNAGPFFLTGTSTDRAKNSVSYTGGTLQTFEYHVPPEILTFPSFSFVSNVLSAGQTFTINGNSTVFFSSGTEAFRGNPNRLLFGVDYTVDTQNRIHLDEILYVDEVQANALGLLTVDVFED